MAALSIRNNVKKKKKKTIALQNSLVSDLHNLTTRLAGKETTMFIIR